MKRDIQENLNSISRKSIEILINDLFKNHQVSTTKVKLSSQKKQELRSLLKDLKLNAEQLTKGVNK